MIKYIKNNNANLHKTPNVKKVALAIHTQLFALQYYCSNLKYNTIEVNQTIKSKDKSVM